MLRAAVLQHDLQDGSSHLDLLIESTAGDDPDERALATFRVAAGADAEALLGITRGSGSAEFDAERSGDHRRLYLSYEGPIPGGRGKVARLATGVVPELSLSDLRCDAVIDFGAGSIALTGVRLGAGPIWRFECRDRK